MSDCVRRRSTWPASELEVSPARPRLYHLRDQDGRREVDIIAELGEERILGFEVKAGASVAPGDTRHLAWLRDELGDRLVAGVVFHTRPARLPARRADHRTPD